MAPANSGAVRHLPAGLCLLALLACSLSLSYQAAQLWRLLQEPPAYTQAPPPTPPRVADRQRLAMLFPAPLPGHAGPAPATSLQLTLVAVFGNPEQQRSSAIIRPHGQTARRVAVGAEVAPGIKLHSVGSHYITLDRHGRRESLHFPVNNHRPLMPAADAREQALAPQPEPVTSLAGR